MSFIFDAFGGGEQTQKQSQKTESKQIPEYSPEALSLMGREVGLLTDVLIPLQRAMAHKNLARMAGAGQMPAAIGGQRAMGLLPGAAEIDPFLSAVNVNDLSQRAALPFQVAEQTRSMLPPQYAQLFAPQMRSETMTESETEAPDVDPFTQALQIGMIGGMFFCWIADALYGRGSVQAVCARIWVSEGWTGRQAKLFRAVYRRLGPRLAPLVKRSRRLDRLFRPLFDHFVKRGWDYLISQQTAIMR